MSLLGPLGIALAVFVAALIVPLFFRGFTDTFNRVPTTAPERVPFTGGLPPAVHAWSRYHARYYIMGLVFLAFDMEMVYMYPWAVVFVERGAVAIVEMGVFILILLLGVLYTWREGAFEWA